MREVGVVTKTNGDFANVKVNKRDECSKCGMCLFPKNADCIELVVSNTLNASVGDSVEIENKESNKLLGSVLAFLVPLVLIIISSLISLLLIGKEIFVLILSVTSIALWYAILPLIDKKLKRTKWFLAQTIKIIKKAEDQKNM